MNHDFEKAGIFGLGKPNDAFAHFALEVPGESLSTEWCEAVLDETYEKL